ncbi:hairy/enhancer-of-split related with YRPW motif protein 1-like [Anneissia japonica]|uniref:hairy/enhancer-of-split related with YRPW motif protein 1-like n=1 Tax=Anneissia japonica TaxID=1529436 RepID=UPI00142551F8|nr:hairy/enhancer-of-split related with YRPW motif protein 1-like [Anneissia japonica]
MVNHNIAMKRGLSESSDNDDVFEESMKGRVRRIIEKRRRDRINTSLSELRRLVPSAFEKQGSAKLEKAEILQMTVDHLKFLHAKGLDSSFHPYGDNPYGADYRSIGFRECASEVARYLVTVECMDIQDPLRLRLMSHLQCYTAQRELQTRQHWNTVSNHPHNHLTHSQYQVTHHQSTTVIPQHGDHHIPVHTPASESNRQMVPMITSSTADSGHQTCHTRLAMPPSTTALPVTSNSGSTHFAATSVPGSIPSVHTQYPIPYNSLPMLSPTGFSPTSNPSHVATHAPVVAKPYRPWGTEMAY